MKPPPESLMALQAASGQRPGSSPAANQPLGSVVRGFSLSFSSPVPATEPTTSPRKRGEGKDSGGKRVKPWRFLHWDTGGVLLRWEGRQRQWSEECGPHAYPLREVRCPPRGLAGLGAARRRVVRARRWLAWPAPRHRAFFSSSPRGRGCPKGAGEGRRLESKPLWTHRE